MRSYPVVLPVVAGVVGAASLPASLWAQTVGGTARVEARCAPDVATRDIHLGDDFVLSRHGLCPAPRDPGMIASINDASVHVQAALGIVFADVLAQTDFRGTSDDEGSANASVSEFHVDATDLVFTDIADPTRDAPITFSWNVVVSGLAETSGASNCFATRPSATVGVIAGAGFSSRVGSLNDVVGSVTGTGLFEGYANDGSEITVVMPEVGAQLGRANTLTLGMTILSSVIHCDQPPAAFSSAHGAAGLHLPCGTPVFNLPPGITANSVQLGILNNIWNGSCCSADFNHDGSVNSQDFFDFLVAFFGVQPSADFNHDGSINSQDFFDFLGVFFVGC